MSAFFASFFSSRRLSLTCRKPLTSRVLAVEPYAVDRRYPSQIPDKSMSMNATSIMHKWPCLTSGIVFASGAWKRGRRSGAFVKNCRFLTCSPLRKQFSAKRSGLRVCTKYMRLHRLMLGVTRTFTHGQEPESPRREGPVSSVELAYHEAASRTRGRTRRNGLKAEKCTRLCSLP